mmetsp:Transcript_42865/g.50151  ORF Transcript_42865/g.50151 Transcript_42865/m.50151 type:complete len:237 (+) Transcript_42865:1037-1747(+)
MNETISPLRKFAALSSIGYAVGSQKLLLNIRHEMVNRNDSTKSLGIALLVFGGAYITVVQLSGPSPPSFLFDAISRNGENNNWNRRLGGFFLWVHVSVSYAINSQALCSSINRLVTPMFGGVANEQNSINHNRPSSVRWGILTLVVAMSSYLIANAVPFFKDLVSLIGALTSVPLTLLLPAILYRKITNQKLCEFTGFASYSLLIFALVFMICGLVGAMSSIELDWKHHGSPFACD